MRDLLARLRSDPRVAWLLELLGHDRDEWACAALLGDHIRRVYRIEMSLSGAYALWQVLRIPTAQGVAA
jgi:hypothetical protein